MRTFFLAFLTTALVACDNSGKIKADVDTAVNDIKNATAVDSIKAKSDRWVDSAKSKGDAVLDSSKRKSGQVLRKVSEELKNLSKKLDSTR